MSETEVHQLKCSVTLKQVSITVRFPCSLSFSLKIDGKVIQSQQMYQLKNGQSQIDEEITIQTEAVYQSRSYERKNISLTIFMVSANGKIPAGSVTLGIQSESEINKKYVLEKCPDKNSFAIVTYKQAVIDVKTIEGIKTEGDQRVSYYNNQNSQREMTLKQSRLSQDSIKQRLRRSRESAQKLSEKSRNQTPRAIESFQSAELHSNQKYSTGRYQGYKSKGNSIKKEHEDYDLKKSQLLIPSTGEKFMEKGYYSRLRSSQYITENKDEQIHMQQMKILKLEKEKAEYIRQLNSLRKELSNTEEQKVNFLADKNSRLNDEVEEISSELEELKEKYKHLQKNDRDYQIKVRSLKDELEQKNIRINQFQLYRTTVEQEKQQLQKDLKQNVTKNKRLTEQIEDLRQKLSKEARKNETRELSYKDQLKKLNEKYSQAETQRQKISLNYNNLLTDIQASEKKHELSLREKERTLTDERNKLSKKVEELSAQNLSLKKQITSTKQECEEFQKKFHFFQKESIKLSEDLLILEDDNKHYQQRADSDRVQIENLRNQIETYQQSFTRQKSSQQKNLSSIEKKLLKSEQQLKSLALDKEKLVKQKQELSKHQEEARVEKNSLEKKISNLERQLQSLKKQENQKQRLAETLSVKNQSHAQKISQLKASLKEKEAQNQKQLGQLRYQIQILVQSNEYMKEEISDLKLECQGQSSKSSQYQEKLREQKQEILSLNQRLLLMLEKESQEEQQKKEIQYISQTYLNEIRVSEEKIKELKSSQQESNEKFYQLKAELKEMIQKGQAQQEKIENFEQNSQNSQFNYKKVISKHQKELAENEEALRKQQRTIKDLNSTIYELKAEVNQTKSALKIKKEDLEEAQQQCRVFRKKVEENDIKEKTTGQKYIEVQMEKDNQQRQNQSLRAELQRKKQQLQNFRTETVHTFQQMISQLNRIEYVTQTQVGIPKSRFIAFNKAFPNEKMNELQMHLFETERLRAQKNYNKINELTSQVKQLKKQLEKQRELAAELEVQQQEEFFCQKQRLQILIQQKQMRVNELQQKLLHSETLNAQLEKENEVISKKVLSFQENTDILNEEIKCLQRDKMTLRQEIDLVQNQLQIQKANEIRIKSQSEKRISQVELKFQMSLSELKSRNSQIQKLLDQTERQLNIKRQQYQSLATSEETSQLKIAELKTDLSEWQYKIEDKSNELTKACKILSQREKQLASKETDYDKIESAYYFELEKAQKISRENAMLREQNESLSIENQKKESGLRKNIQNLEDLSLQLQNFQKQKQDLQANHRREALLSQKQWDQLKSKLQITEFQNHELHQKCQSLQEAECKLRESLTERLKQIEKLQKDMEKVKNQEILSLNREQNLQQEINLKQEEVFNLKRKIEELEQIQVKLSINKQLMHSIKSQNQNLKEKMEKSQKFYQSTSKELRSSLIESKKELANRCTKQEEQRKKIRNLQSQLQIKNQSLHDQKTQWLKEAEAQKKSLRQEIEDLEKKRLITVKQFEFEVEQLKKEVESYLQEIENLSENLKECQITISNQQIQNTEHQNQIEILRNDLQSTKEKWKQQKATYHPTKQKIQFLETELSRFQQFSRHVDGKGKQLLELAKKKAESLGSQVDDVGISSILRDIGVTCMRTKTKVLSRCHNDKQKELVIADYRILQQKLEQAMKSHGVMKPIGMH